MYIKTISVGDLKENCYIVEDSKSCFVVDPGDEADKIIKQLGKRQLQFILLTHGHFDHILALDELHNGYPKATIYITKEDEELISNLSEQGHYVRRNLNNIELPVKTIEQGDKINFNDKIIKVIQTPGHTLGSACFLIENNLFSGDTLFYHAIGRTDLWTSDQIAMTDSLKKLSRLPQNTIVYPGHGRPTTIAEEAQNGYLPNIKFENKLQY